MPSGGFRAKAGRPRGSKNRKDGPLKKAQFMGQAEIVRLAGETPLEWALRVRNDESVPMKTRADMAKAAAPYCHARLATKVVEPEAEEVNQAMKDANPWVGLVN